LKKRPVADNQEASPGIEAVDLGFGKQHRLQTAADFSLVFADRRPLRGEIFDLHYRSRDLQAIPKHTGARLGVVIAKKLAHRAVQRNLLKRLARETFRLARHELPHYDLVLRLAKAPGNCLDASARKIWRADIEHLLIRLPR